MSIKSDQIVIHEQYLEMKQGGSQNPATPVYADPHAMIENGQLYENEVHKYLSVDSFLFSVICILSVFYLYFISIFSVFSVFGCFD